MNAVRKCIIILMIIISGTECHLLCSQLLLLLRYLRIAIYGLNLSIYLFLVPINSVLVLLLAFVYIIYNMVQTMLVHISPYNNMTKVE